MWRKDQRARDKREETVYQWLLAKELKKSTVPEEITYKAMQMCA